MLTEDLERIEVLKSNQKKLAMILTEHANIRQKLEMELQRSRDKENELQLTLYQLEAKIQERNQQLVDLTDEKDEMLNQLKILKAQTTRTSLKEEVEKMSNHCLKLQKELRKSESV